MVISLIDSEKVEATGLNEKADKVEKREDPAIIVKEYEKNIRAKKNIIYLAYHQSKLFKRFKEKEKFIPMLTEFKVYKSTMIFKIIIEKLIDKFPELMKSSVTLKMSKKYVSKMQVNLSRSLSESAVLPLLSRISIATKLHQ